MLRKIEITRNRAETIMTIKEENEKRYHDRVKRKIMFDKELCQKKIRIQQEKDLSASVQNQKSMKILQSNNEIAKNTRLISKIGDQIIERERSRDLMLKQEKANAVKEHEARVKEQQIVDWKKKISSGMLRYMRQLSSEQSQVEKHGRELRRTEKAEEAMLQKIKET